MVVAVMVVKLDNAAVAVAAMDVVLIQIIVAHRASFSIKDYSTVTDFAKFLGLSTSVFFLSATW